MLGIRLSSGLSIDGLIDPEAIADLSHEGLITVVPSSLGPAEETDAAATGGPVTRDPSRERLDGGWGEDEAKEPDRLVLTRRGRLVADRVVDRLT